MHWLELKVKPPIVAIIAILFMVILDYVCSAEIVNIGFDHLRLMIAFGLVGSGGLFAFAGIGLFLKLKTTVHPDLKHDTNQLVISGVYKLSRNPMYLGILFNLIAVSLWLNNWLTIMVCIGFVLYITQFQIKPEERFLQHKFGKKYLDYCQKVRRWL